MKIDKTDARFQKWLAIVSPTPQTTQAVLASEAWVEILVILLKIFAAILSSGCIQKANVTRKVKATMRFAGDYQGTVVNLSKILQEI